MSICKYKNCTELIYNHKYGLCKKHHKVQNLETFILRFGPDEGARRYQEMIDKRSFSKSFTGMIEKYGDIEGQKRWFNYCKKQGERNTLAGKMKCWGTEIGPQKWEQHKKKCGSPVRREFFLEDAQAKYDLADFLLSERQKTFTKDKCIEKYGEKRGIEVWEKRQNDWLTKLKNKTPEEITEINKKKSGSLFNFIRKYGKNLGLQKYKNSNQKKRLIIENFIKKYGEDEGKKRWKTWYDKKIEILKTYISSKISLEFFDEIQTTYNIKIQKEVKIGKYVVDGLYINKIIEFFGDYWHCNPMIYESDFFNPLLKKYAIDKWVEDYRRIKYFTKKGYEVIIIWENDWKKNKKDVMQICYSKLKK